MRFFLIILLVLVLIWLWRNKRPGLPTPKKTAPTSAMVACVHCTVHLPASEALKGKKGMYCSEEHRRASEG